MRGFDAAVCGCAARNSARWRHPKTISWTPILIIRYSHYDTLGVSRNASQKDIKEAFLKKSLKFHPDRNPHADAAKYFTKCANAYDVLKKVKSRQEYDYSLRPSLNPNYKSGPSNPYGHSYYGTGSARYKRSPWESRTYSGNPFQDGFDRQTQWEQHRASYGYTYDQKNSSWERQRAKHGNPFEDANKQRWGRDEKYENLDQTPTYVKILLLLPVNLKLILLISFLFAMSR